ncbi:hypothetical protein [uncultured Thiodictyon sp.]|nr:hypothetical protein [uncultured Thiodictyon sp.]
MNGWTLVGITFSLAVFAVLLGIVYVLWVDWLDAQEDEHARD